MQRLDADANLSDEQDRAAAAGAKAMMPVGRPFLDYVLCSLADAGFSEICIVVSPGDGSIRTRYTKKVVPRRFALTYAEQAEPLGTADAVRAARDFVGDDMFVSLNADNLYDPSALQAIREAAGPALCGFAPKALTRLGNIPPERIASYALLRTNASGNLVDIVEKPDAAAAAMFGPSALVSMNLWAFSPDIFVACDRIERSQRGELELASAVHFAIQELGIAFRVIGVDGWVLDLTNRGDIASVARRLSGASVSL
jgi:glucose-1-phosphate thymidylyltransferase